MIANVLAEQTLTLFLIIIIGYIARRTNVIKDDMTKKLSDFLLYITLPLLIITSFNFQFSKTMLVNGGIVLISSFAIHFACFGLGKWLFIRFPAAKRKILIFAAVFSNCGFMGIPIIESIYGKIGVFYSSIYQVAFNLLIWTLGIVIFTEKLDRKTARSTLTNPGIIAVFIGMIFFVFSIPLPAPVLKTFTMVGSMTTPLSMIIVGATLADCRWQELFSDLSVYYGSLARLVLLPLITMGILNLFHLDSTVAGVCVLSVAMPVAATTAIISELHDGDTSLASRVIFLSTVFSIITIPGIMVLFEILHKF